MARSLIPTIGLNRFVAQPLPTPISGDTTNGHYVINGGSVCLVMSNVGGASITVSLVLPTGVDEDLVAPFRTYSIPTGSIPYFAYGFPQSVYGEQLYVNVSSSNARLYAFTLVAS
jgi:hypothetical protein